MGLASLALFPLVSLDLLTYDLWYVVYGTAVLIAFGLGLRRNRPAVRGPWVLLALGIGAAVAGDFAYPIFDLGSWELPYPSVADAFYLSSYPLLAVGLVGLLRARTPGRDRTSLIDAGLVTVAAASISWAFLIEPYARDSSTLAEKMVTIAYPLMDILLVAVAARMLMVGVLRARSYVLLLGAIATQMVGDTLYGLGSLNGWYSDGSWIDLVSLSSYLLFGAAVLHPSMNTITQAKDDPETRLTGQRIAGLVGASLLPLGIVVYEVAKSDPYGAFVAAGAVAAVLVLVTSRLVIAMGRHEQVAHREESLREAAAALVSARAPADIERIVETAVLRLAAPTPARVTLHPAGVADPPPASATIFPLTVLGESAGAIVVETAQPLRRASAKAIETLSSQVALALESAVLTSDLLERQSAERFRTLVENSSDVILVLELDGTIRYEAPSVESVLGYQASELVGKSFLGFVQPEARERARDLFERVRTEAGSKGRDEFRALRQDGSACVLEAVFKNLQADESIRGIVLTARDVTERRRLEEELRYQALNDGLTGLANRVLLLDRLAHALSREQRTGKRICLLFIDLDDFKDVNDSFGHTAGDELLALVGSSLRAAVRPADTCARLGGDEFAVLLEEAHSPEAAIAAAERILEFLSEPHVVAGAEIRVRASVGVAFGGSPQTPADVLRNADAAMYKAKGEGKGGIAVFDATMHGAASERLRLRTELEHAVSEGEFVLHYQPIVEVASGAITALEALVRWQHPRRGLLAPHDFIPLAEETGLIVPIGRWVLQEACTQLARWKSVNGRPLSMNVNLSVKELGDPRLLEHVARALADCGLDPADLTCEVTETGLMKDADAAEAQLRSLKELGVKVAIDDFGTGYSSLEYINRFPADSLKIDKTFIDKLGTGGADDRLATLILHLGSTLGLTSVAEGVEEQAQYERLRELSCGFAQGFHLARPMAPAAIDQLLRHPPDWAPTPRSQAA